VVIAIIALLASIVSASLSSARAKARDAFRKSALHELKNALELYHAANNAYPVAKSDKGLANEWFSSEPDDSAPNGDNNDGKWIPDLVAQKYISSLPKDPRGGASLYSNCGTWKSAFWYESDGKNYKLLSHCAPEGTLSPNDSFFDPIRPTNSWMVTNKGDMPPIGNCESKTYKYVFGTDYPICW